MDDPAALADAMDRVISDRDYRDCIRHAGLLRARRYDLPKVLSQWESLFDATPLAAESPGKSRGVAA
jgi:glycosyltransferase involved in cell wall biosynthesis